MYKKFIIVPLLFAFGIGLLITPTVQVVVLSVDFSYGPKAQANTCPVTSPLTTKTPKQVAAYLSTVPAGLQAHCKQLCWFDACGFTADIQALQQIFQQAQELIQQFTGGAGGGGAGGSGGISDYGGDYSNPDYSQGDAIDDFYDDFLPPTSDDDDNNRPDDDDFFPPTEDDDEDTEVDNPYSKPGALPQTYFCTNTQSGCSTNTNSTSNNSGSNSNTTNSSQTTGTRDTNNGSSNSSTNNNTTGGTGSGSATTNNTTAPKQKVYFTSPELESFIQRGGDRSSIAISASNDGSVLFFEAGNPDRVIYGDDQSGLIEQIQSGRAVSREEAIRLLQSGEVVVEYGSITDEPNEDSANPVDMMFSWTEANNPNSELPSWLMRLYENRYLILPVPLLYIAF